jgi:GNAT superfamily N-acetyltransferase
MLSFRTFRNTDPPAVIDIWRSRAGQPGLLQPVSADLFEQLVFAKPYFDCRGLILAADDGRAVGFAHAGFGPNDGQSDISTELGVTCAVLVRPDYPAAEVAAGLLQHTEQYLLGRGAKVLYGGAIRPLNPFYLGLYGGAELPGILTSDHMAIELFRGHGYREIDQTLIFRRDLTDFQVPMDRAQLALRRQMTIQMTADPPSRNWWDACTTADFDLTRFEVMPRGGGQVLARATFRGMEPAGASTFVRAAGLIDLEVDAGRRRQGLATYLLGEAFQSCSRQGIMLVEVQTMARNAAAIALYRKLGFRQADQGIVFRKEA